MLLGAILLTLMAACASIGHPEGGPRDTTPPVFMASDPMPGTTNFAGKKITLTFDENIQLDDASSKIVVSPAQSQTPAFSSNGKRVTIELRDTLLPNATYTIDLADAVKDLNEGNILDGLAIDFATGDSIDSLKISGMVLEARTLEPAQGMLVGVYSDLSDTAITTRRLERIAKTNQLGQFTIRNLKPGEYRVYAINDMNRDYMWDRSEDIAVYPLTVSPRTEPTEVTDTFVDAAGNDSLVTRPATRFLPDDLLLTWFNENYRAQYLREHKRDDRRIIYLEFGAVADSLPKLTLLDGPTPDDDITRWARLDRSETFDTLRYWITDTAILNMDTLTIATTYLRTDTNQELTWTTDTIKYTYRAPKRTKKAIEAENKRAAAKLAKASHPLDSLHPDSMVVDSFLLMQPDEWLDFKALGGSQADLHLPLNFTVSEPIARFDSKAVVFEIQNDSLWDTLPTPDIYRPIDWRLLEYRMDNEWIPGAKYRLTVDSAAIVSVYGLWNKPFKHEFSAKQLEDYSTLTFNVTGLDSLPAIAELLSSSDKIVASAPVTGGKATFMFVTPGTYYARLFIDANANGEYDAGSIADKRQPEDTYYYPKKIALKKNWDVEQTWDLNETAVDQQKPLEIKKNKPKTQKGEKEPAGDGEEDDEYYYDDAFGSGNYFDYGTGGNRNNNYGGGAFGGNNMRNY